MERMTKKEMLAEHEVNYVSGDDCFCVWSTPEKFMGEAIDRLAAYEDTGLEPKDIEALQKREQGLAELLVNVSCGCDVSYTRLAELVQAEKDGRLVVLDEPRKPLVWGDDNHDSVLCPNCNHDLMGGFLKAGFCEKSVYQCPYCGSSVDGTKALTREEAEAALKKREEADNAKD